MIEIDYYTGNHVQDGYWYASIMIYITLNNDNTSSFEEIFNFLENIKQIIKEQTKNEKDEKECNIYFDKFEKQDNTFIVYLKWKHNIQRPLPPKGYI